MQLLTRTAVERVLAGLAQQRDQVVDQVLIEARALDGYVSLDQPQLEDFRETVGEGLDAVVAAMADMRSFDDADVAFLWGHIRRRTQAGVSEGDMLAVVRLFQRVLWDAIFELGGDDDEGREVALVLARPLIGYTDALSHAVHRAYAEADRALSLRSSAIRLHLLEALLAGEQPTPGDMLSAARSAGLDHDRPLAVITARPVQGAPDSATLAVASLAVARAAGDVVEPLTALRSDEIVVVRPVPGGDASGIGPDLEAAHARLLERGLHFAIGASTVHPGLAGVPAAYREACLAQEQVRETGGVLSLSGLSVADYLILRAGDHTAWRLVPPDVRRFVVDDAMSGSVLSDTLLAYVDCDMSVKLAAERLFVHPNTAHYRLARIEERTHLSVRRLVDVLLLVIAIRLQRSVSPPP